PLNQIKLNMESDQDQELLSVDSKNHLVVAGSWARFIGIMGFVFTAFFGLLSILLITGGPSMMSMIAAANPEASSSGFLKGSTVFIGLLYLIITAIYFVISWWTFKFGNEIKQGLRENDPDIVTSSFGNLKNYFQAYGVLTLIAVTLMVFSVLTMLMVGFFR
ncbi:MAG: hypothetical protein ABI761_11130, partial [Saprospiraceae bacterium]